MNKKVMEIKSRKSKTSAYGEQNAPTIVACSTALPAAIAVIRISGSESQRLLELCFRSNEKVQHRMLRVGTLEIDTIDTSAENDFSLTKYRLKDEVDSAFFAPENSTKIDTLPNNETDKEKKRDFKKYEEYNFAERGKVRDKATAVFFSAPQSYTGDDMAEISIHGSAALAQNLLQFLIKNGARAADRGEFTRRAFLNGKLDLSSAEGVLEMINAESASELRAAFCEMQGGVRREIESLQERLTKIIAGVEAALDFPDEVDGEEYIAAIEPIKKGLKRLVESYQSGKLIKNGIKIAALGGVNVGKSSLVNALLQADRAIVTDIPGTTRDTLEGCFEHKGQKFVIIDTAGLREGGDAIEQLGMERSLRAVSECDIILAVCEAGGQLEPRVKKVIDKAMQEANINEAVAQGIMRKSSIKSEFNHSNNSCKNGNNHINNNGANIDVSELCEIKNAENLNEENSKKPVIYIENKTDILAPTNPKSIKISAKTGEGIEKLKDEILQKTMSESGGIIITNARHYEALSLALAALVEVEQGNIPPECMAEGLMAAYNELGKITGAVGSEEIIDRIFSEFCVGK